MKKGGDNLKITTGTGKLGTLVEVAYEDVKSSNKKIEDLKKKKVFEGKKGQVFPNVFSDESVIYLGLGKKAESSLEDLRLGFCKLGAELNKSKVDKASFDLGQIKGLTVEEAAEAIVEGLLQSEYSFDKFLSEKKERSLKEFALITKDKDKEVKAIIKEVTSVIGGVFLARDLVNEPAMYMTPTALANAAKELEKLGVEVEVHGQKEIEKLGMKAFLAVAKGSEQEPKLIIMKWNGDKRSKDKTALVGKGLTYDSGGYGIKSTGGMVDMHSDMAGSASVIGAFKALAENKVKKNVVGIIAACENMISGGAYKNGDIISSMAGKSIHIGSTDAEGRLTLADALYYIATKEKPNRIIDIATLTGAVIGALGGITTGIVSNDDDFAYDVVRAGNEVGEPAWLLPLNDKYRDMVKGTFSDLLNSQVGSAKGGGAITAGAFLENFVEDTPWVHMDIAGTSYNSAAEGYLPKGGTGVPVKTLYHYIKTRK